MCSQISHTVRMLTRLQIMNRMKDKLLHSYICRTSNSGTPVEEDIYKYFQMALAIVDTITTCVANK